MTGGGPIEGRHVVLLTVDPAGLHVSVCGVCSALVAVEHDGELRHLVQHERAGQLGDGGR